VLRLAIDLALLVAEVRFVRVRVRGAFGERRLTDDFELIGESDTREGVALLEYVTADSSEVFVTDDALEGDETAKRRLFDDFELIGESDTREGVAFMECCRS